MLNKEIKNNIHMWHQHLTDLGHTNEFISRVVDMMVKVRGPVTVQGGKYPCSCNSWGPRWIENSLTGICPGCWALALECDQEMKVNGVKPVTMEMIDNSQSWGFDRDKIRELNQ